MKAKKYVGTFVVALLGGLIALIAYSTISGKFLVTEKIVNVEQDPQMRFANLPSSPLGSNSLDFTSAAEKSVNAVVHVKSEYEQNYNMTIYDYFFGQTHHQAPPVVQTSGSGVILSADGYIVTNSHVIEGSDNIEIVLNDKRTFEAKLIGTDKKTDIALLKIDSKDLPFLSYANSDDIKIGEWVLAVGNPFNLTSTVTAGIVSAKARNINILSKFAIESFIQTDAAVNPGNSGGALVNTNGDLVGINTAIASNTGSFTGYSFAVPVNMVKKVVSDLIEFGEVQRAYIGVYPRDIDAELAAQIAIDKIEGVYVEGVNENGAAEAAGIAPGDIITHIGNQKVNNVPGLQEQVGNYRPGDKINVIINRKNEKKEIIVELRNMQGKAEIIKHEDVIVMGAKFREISSDEKRKLRINWGVKIVEINDGALSKAGIKNGFIITHINKTPVTGEDEIQSFLGNVKGGVLIEGIYPNGLTAYYTFGV